MTRHGRRQSRHGKAHSRSRHQVGNCPTGLIDLHHGGYGFVNTEEGQFYIPANRTGGAFSGDLVEVRPRGGRAGGGLRREAVVTRVLKRNTEYVAGVLEVHSPLAAVIPADPRIKHDIFVDPAACPQARDGDMVLARITVFPTRHQAAQGYIVETLGRADDPGMDVDILIHGAGLPGPFSKEALDEAEAMEVDVEAALEELSRHDLRERDVFTIDPVDAKDFDDAISLDQVEGYVRLGVHIADVSAYVKWGSSIDVCARDRATSVYLADRVLPMLPEKLSCDVCSLRPGQDRLTFTCDMFIDEAGKICKYQLHPTVIRSRRRFNYDEVQEVLEGRLNDPYAPKLRALSQLAKKLLKRREEQGALDFDNLEAKPILDEEGRVLRIDLRRKTDATSMVEEAMIAANHTVALHAFRKKISLPYRVHLSPRPKSLEKLLPCLKQLGYSVEGLAVGDAKAYQRVLEQAQGRPEQPLVDSLVLRSMERAHYTTSPEPHFGLALAHYCHFTSPIRRYPDLMVHRLLKDASSMSGELDWLAAHSSKMERLAEEVERDTVNLKICQYLEERLGQVFSGAISTVTPHGFFVRLENTAEGFVRLDEVKDGYHDFDAKMQTLVAEETGRTYRLGQQVRVRVASVSCRELQIDFALV